MEETKTESVKNKNQLSNEELIENKVDNKEKEKLEMKNCINKSFISKFDTSIADRKITDIDELPEVDMIDKEFPFSKNNYEFVKNKKPIRMGHASLSYLRNTTKIMGK